MVNTFIGGTLQFMIDGVQFNLGGSFKYRLGGQKRKTKNGLNGTLGFVTEYSEAMIEAQLSMDGSVSVAQLKAISNSTLTATLDNGRTIVLYNAWQTDDDPEIDAKEAEATFKFAGLRGVDL